MPHSQSFDAIVLKTYDVGEADRFCVLFTREKGRITARASGARRSKSKLGAALLSFRHLTIEAREGSGGYFIASVSDTGERPAQDMAQFLMLEEGIELLLRLVSHEGALPDIFDATLNFIAASHNGVAHADIAYGFALLHHLGLLPEQKDLGEFSTLGAVEYEYVRAARAGSFIVPDASCSLDRLRALRTILMGDHLQGALKTPAVLAAMA